jgi:hypothetical protein
MFPSRAQRVEAIAERLGDVPLQIAAQYYLSGASYLSGDYRATERVCRKLMQRLHGQTIRERFGLVVSPAVGFRYGRSGDAARAREHLTTATGMYREMAMRFWLERAETAMAGVA